jgi:hypothetical protein
MGIVFSFHSIRFSMYSYSVEGKCYERNRVIPNLGFVSRFIVVDMEIHPVIHLITIVLSNKKELILIYFNFFLLLILFLLLLLSSITIHIYVFIPIKHKAIKSRHKTQN